MQSFKAAHQYLFPRLAFLELTGNDRQNLIDIWYASAVYPAATQSSVPVEQRAKKYIRK